MITLPNGTRLVEERRELPDLRGSNRLYADFETSSGDPGEDSINPWHNCSPIGVAVTADDREGSWFVPSTTPGWEEWFGDVVKSARVWVNHNVKYDAHVAINAGCLEFDSLPVLVCTVVHSKLVDSDMLSYSLDMCALRFLSEDIREYEARLKPYLHKNKDYGLIPLDLLAEYAGQDVLTNRRLDRYLVARMPEESHGVRDTETALTRVLVRMERTGVRVDPQELKLAELQVLAKMLRIEEGLSKRVGFPFRPHVNEDCFDVFCNTFGMPIKAYTVDKDGNETENPSFDKEALRLYLAHPGAPVDLVQAVIDYRQMNTFRNLFLTPYQLLHVDGVLHSDHNQCIRTGRMACRRPNMQQLSKLAKSLIHPPPGWGFLSADYSQIEFRVIVHYINDPACVKAYNDDPYTDFHRWMADMAGMKRRPAKTMNFQMGYGGGKKRAVSSLAVNPDVAAEVLARVESLIESGKLTRDQLEHAFAVMCTKKGEALYEKYHDTLPSLKPTSRKAESVCVSRGYVRNLAGRRRSLPKTHAWRAFNSLCQSLAADIQKERTVALYEATRGTPIELNALVHDETLLSGPDEVMRDERTVRDVVGLMVDSQIKMRVPIRCTWGYSTANWKLASAEEKRWDRTEYDNFTHLKELPK